MYNWDVSRMKWFNQEYQIVKFLHLVKAFHIFAFEHPTHFEDGRSPISAQSIPIPYISYSLYTLTEIK